MPFWKALLSITDIFKKVLPAYSGKHIFEQSRFSWSLKKSKWKSFLSLLLYAPPGGALKSVAKMWVWSTRGLPWDFSVPPSLHRYASYLSCREKKQNKMWKSVQILVALRLEGIISHDLMKKCFPPSTGSIILQTDFEHIALQISFSEPKRPW